MSNREILRRLEARGVDVLAILAGDRPLDTAAFTEVVNAIDRVGDELPADLIELLTTRRLAPTAAADLWTAILTHRDRLAESLGRNPGVRVAAADLLVNLRGELRDIRILDRGDFEPIEAHCPIDVPTGVGNRSAILELYDREVERARRYHKSFSLLAVELDHHEELARAEGTVAAEALLVEVARRLRETCRGSDAVGRLGGARFLLILPETGGREAVTLAERLRERIAGEPLLPAGGGAPLQGSLTVGIASFPEDGRDPPTLLERAEQALRDGRAEGRAGVRRAFTV